MKLPRKLRLLLDYVKGRQGRVAFLETQLQNLQELVLAMRMDGGMCLDEQTKASFAWQWQYVKEGNATTYDEKFMNKVAEEIYDMMNWTSERWKHATVLDVGCGNGRWALGFCKLGAKVTVLDASEYALQHTTTLCKTHGYDIEAAQVDLNFMQIEGEWDLVWCFGVAHHTTQPYNVLQKLAHVVVPDGYLFVMLYGWPENWLQRIPVNQYERLRRETAHMDFFSREQFLKSLVTEDDLHGMFDAVSPKNNWLMTWDQVVFLLTSLGFDPKRVRKGKEHRNHYVIARKGEL